MSPEVKIMLAGFASEPLLFFIKYRYLPIKKRCDFDTFAQKGK